MKRLPRKISDALAGLSLLLFMTAMILWASGYLIVYAPLKSPWPRISNGWTPRWTELVIPWWYALVLTAVLPVLWFSDRLRHRRRTRVGACPTCGYDLRATPDRCPECGAIAGNRDS